MHIDKVTLEGFLSYRQEVVLGPLSPGINVIIGKNGSGKSNLLYAIETLVSREPDTLTHKQRCDVLSRGPGTQGKLATVKLQLVNASRRFPTEEDTVVITRVVAPHHASLQLGSKLVTKKEMLDYLYSAGFSNDNTFHVLRQGQVQEVVRMSSQDRLRLVRHFAGVNAWTEMEQESKQCSEQGSRYQDSAQEVLDHCTERVQEMQESEDELRLYRTCELECRTIGLVIQETDIKDLEKRRFRIEKKMEDALSQFGTIRHDFLQFSGVVEEKKQELKSAKQEAELQKMRQESLADELLNVQTQIIREKLVLDRVKEDAITTGDALADLEREEEKVEEDAVTLTAELTELQNKLRVLEEQESELRRRYEAMIEQRDTALKTMARGTTFHTTEECDAWINNELYELDICAQNAQSQVESLSHEVQQCTAERDRCIAKLQAAQAELESLHELGNKLNAELLALQKDHFQHVGKTVWDYRRQEDCQASFRSAQDAFMKSQSQMMDAMGRAEYTGWQNLKKLLEDEELSQASLYKGMLLDFVRVPDALHCAVAALLGKRLFTHLVPNATAATTLLRKFNDRKMQGCIGFQALDKVNPKLIDTRPTEQTVKYLLDLIDCEDELKHALPHWLGKWLLCDGLEMAKEARRKYKLNCVTLEGDIVQVSGAMTGGYREPKKNKFKVYTQFCQAMDVLKYAKAEKDIVAKDVLSHTKEMEERSLRMQNLETKILRNGHAITSLDSDCVAIQTEVLRLEEVIRIKEQALAERSRLVNQCGKQREGLAEELSTSRTKKSALEVRQRLQEGSRQSNELRKQLKEVSLQKRELLQKTASMESTFQCKVTLQREHFKKERLELEKRAAAEKNELELVLCKLRTLKESRHSLKSLLKEGHDQTIEKKIQDLEGSLAILLEDLSNRQERLDSVKEMLHQLTVQKQAALETHEECKKKVNLWGTVSKKLDRYRKMERHELYKARQTYQRKLDQMDVPSLATVSLSKETATAIRSINKELQDTSIGRRNLNLLTESERQQRMETLEFTLKQVSKYFSDIFCKFVPHGKAEMVIEVVQPSQSQDGNLHQDKFKGIELKARFGRRGPLQSVGAFSGGQKSVVALSFILAMQKSDPAPFYLFDEIDSHLDREHRLSLANILEELSSESQFICTSFNPELVMKGRVFQVSFQSGRSHVHAISQEEAFAFLQSSRRAQRVEEAADATADAAAVAALLPQ